METVVIEEGYEDIETELKRYKRVNQQVPPIVFPEYPEPYMEGLDLNPSPVILDSQYQGSFGPGNHVWSVSPGGWNAAPPGMTLSNTEKAKIIPEKAQPPEENYHITFPINNNSIPEGLTEEDITAIDNYISIQRALYVLSLPHPSEAFFTRYYDGLRLNRKGGPAVIYFNGQTEYWIRGKRIYQGYIDLLEKMSPDRLLTWRNIEERREFMEVLGNDGMARKLKPILSEVNSGFLNDRLYTLYKTNPIRTPGYEPISLYFIHVEDASTTREYYLQVPPMKDALEAVAWTFYKDKKTYHPKYET